ncbi:restriction endonuclease subunit S [Bacillus cereus]|uniref:restriction endonuclease subunit S n=1 Tax=Bacillus cereus TaxID=1396 RepID=UPI001F0DD0C4|nr:restriction endonuclease subunit S [Bacillus cereus]MCH5476429.1 restriction endonuclease subunit S [Bacillus cereus]
MSKKNKTLDVLLEEALVPEDEQPYEIPYGWAWVKLKNIVNIKTGKKDANYGTEDGQYPFFTCAKEPSRSPGYSYDEEALLVPGNGNIGTVMYYNGQFEAYQRTYIISSENINLKYLYYHMLYSWGKFNKDKLFGSTISYIKLANLQEYPVALPPVRVQEIIVEHIEKYLSKVIKAKQLLEEAKETFELRRAAILERAFEGKYLSNDQNKSIQKMKLEDVCVSITDGDHQAPPKVDKGIPFLVISNINKGILDFNVTRFVPEQYYEKINEKRKPRKGDVLYSVVGSYGIPALVEDEKEFCFQRHIAILKPKETLNSKFLYYVLQTRDVFNQATGVSTGTAQITVPLTGLRKIEIPVPIIEVQELIVNIIEKFITKEKMIFDEYLSKVNIELLKQSILFKAFKGEFSSNDLTNESAIELLKLILQEKL